LLLGQLDIWILAETERVQVARGRRMLRTNESRPVRGGSLSDVLGSTPEPTRRDTLTRSLCCICESVMEQGDGERQGLNTTGSTLST
jgi:hypothetical protein